MSIANAVGNPIRVDPNNLNRTKLNSAQVCVEIDVAAPLIDSVWVGFEEDESQDILDGFWVKVFYDVIPPFCTSCFHIGHAMGVCKRTKLVVTNSNGAGTESMAGAAKVFNNLSHKKSATYGTEGKGVEKVFDKMSHTGRTQPGTDQVAAVGGVNQTNNPAALTIVNSFNSCSALKGSTSLGKTVEEDQIRVVQVEAIEQTAATLDQSIPKSSRPGVLASNKSAAHGAQFEAVSGGAEATICVGNGNISEVKAQLTRKSPVAAKNAEKHAEATEKRSALPLVNTSTSRADLVEKEGRKLVQIADSLEEVFISKAETMTQLQEEHANNEVSTKPGTVLQAEAHIGGAVIDDDQHTKDG
ncbi:hypothetical protein LIER_31276 [Lithospermum erythrorhizon]|uniref:Zinc knuckle CX2CX4HX4C domain-containing protein n=1 Tax=Lithospermum erythrorhizon TaxID=34254 RepID=A0AAV3RRG6_LITER